MPRTLSRAGIAVALLLAPSLAFAAASDVTLTTDAVISVNGITLNVSGSGGSVESMIINPTNFSVTLLSGSTFEATAPGREQLAVDNTDDATGSICSDSQSVIGYAATKTMTVVVTPSTALCASVPVQVSGGGGSYTAPSSSSTSDTSTTSTGTSSSATASSATEPAVATTPAESAVESAPAVLASGLSASQVQSIIDVLVSFDVDAETLAKVRAALTGTAGISANSSPQNAFTRDLEVGVKGEDVRVLQKFLNAHGYQVASSGPGSPGNETTMFGSLTRAAVIKYQKAKGITPTVGYFGMKTRAAVNADS